MRKAFFLLILTIFTVLPIFSETVGLKDFCLLYLSGSDAISTAEENLENAELDLEGARAARVSALDMINYETAYTKAQLDLTDIKNAELIKALQDYINLEAAELNVRLTQSALDAAEQTAQAEKKQYDLGLISETDYLNKRLTLLTSEEAAAKAKRTLEDKLTEIKRAVGFDLSPAELGLKIENLLDKLTITSYEKAAEFDAELFRAKNDLVVKQKSASAISSSPYASNEEIENSTKELEAAETALQKAEWALYDSVLSLNRQTEDLRKSYKKELLNMDLAKIALESAELKTSYGEKTELDLLKAKNSYQSSLNSFDNLAGSIFIQLFLIEQIMDGDCQKLLDNMAD